VDWMADCPARKSVAEDGLAKMKMQDRNNCTIVEYY
jgi:hypothetical protein